MQNKNKQEHEQNQVHVHGKSTAIHLHLLHSFCISRIQVPYNPLLLGLCQSILFSISLNSQYSNSSYLERLAVHFGQEIDSRCTQPSRQPGMHTERTFCRWCFIIIRIFLCEKRLSLYLYHLPCHQLYLYHTNTLQTFEALHGHLYLVAWALTQLNKCLCCFRIQRLCGIK